MDFIPNDIIGIMAGYVILKRQMLISVALL